MGRYAIDEAKALGIVVGADTLLIGTIGSAGNGYIVDARAVDANTGERLASVSQEFEAEAFGVYADMVTNTTTVLGGAARSLVSGLGAVLSWRCRARCHVWLAIRLGRLSRCRVRTHRTTSCGQISRE